MRHLLVVTALATTLLGCIAGGGPATPDPVPGGAVKWSYIAVGQVGVLARAVGFAGALPAGTTLTIRVDGKQVATAQPDSAGRFDVGFDAAPTAELSVSGGELADPETLTFAVRNTVTSTRDAVNLRLAQTGAVPNHLVFADAFGSASDALLLVVNSGDNAVDNVSLRSGGRAHDPAVLTDVPSGLGPVPAQPFAVVALGGLAAVTRFGQSGVTLFDIATGVEVASVREQQARALANPFAPPVAVDGNGDGTAEALVTTLLPRSFEGLVAVNQRLFVCAANLLKSFNPTVYGPGMVMLYDTTATSLGAASPDHVVTTYLNPQAAVTDGARVYVVETGTLVQGAGGWTSGSEGGIDVIDAASGTLVTSISLGSSAPGSAAVSVDGRFLLVGSLLRAELYKIDLASLTLVRGPANPIVLFDSDEVQSVFAVQVHPMGVAFASTFNTDQVHTVDVTNEVAAPFPFSMPFQVGAGGAAFEGAHAVALRAGLNGVDFQGADLAVLMSLAGRVATIDTRFLMGP